MASAGVLRMQLSADLIDRTIEECLVDQVDAAGISRDDPRVVKTIARVRAELDRVVVLLTTGGS